MVTNILTNVVFSAYCACAICCGPMAKGIAANGRRPQQAVTIAGPRAIPLRTKVLVQVPGTIYARHIFTVEDRLARKWDGKRWDIFFKSHEAAKQWGLKRGTVTIVTK